MDSTTITLLTHPCQLVFAAVVLVRAARAVFSIVPKTRTNEASAQVEAPAHAKAA